MTEGSVLASPAVVRYGTIRALAAVTINSHAPDMRLASFFFPPLWNRMTTDARDGAAAVNSDTRRDSRKRSATSRDL
jgi:hypothetical protein